MSVVCKLHPYGEISAALHATLQLHVHVYTLVALLCTSIWTQPAELFW